MPHRVNFDAPFIINGASKQSQRSIKTRFTEHENRSNGASKQSQWSIKTHATEHQNTFWHGSWVEINQLFASKYEKNIHTMDALLIFFYFCI